MTTQITESIKSLNPDFSEVEWEVVPENLTRRTVDYSSLESVKILLSGEAISIPPNTKLNKLYNWLVKRNYRLRTRTFKDNLIIWVEKKPEYPSEEESINAE
jgi:hypothetical protein